MVTTYDAKVHELVTLFFDDFEQQEGKLKPEERKEIIHQISLDVQEQIEDGISIARVRLGKS